MLNSIPNHFSYLFENKNVQSVGQRKVIAKRKDDSFKAPLKKKKQNDKIEKELQKVEQINESEYEQYNKINQCASNQQLFQNKNKQLTSHLMNQDQNSQHFESKLEQDALNQQQYQQNFFMYDKFQKKHSFQQEEKEDHDSFNENNTIMKSNQNKNNQEGNKRQQYISNAFNAQEKINQERINPVQGLISSNNNVKKTYNQEFNSNSSNEMIFWRRANQLQTKFQTMIRPAPNHNNMLLKGDLYLEIDQNMYNSSIAYLPLSYFKRISSIKKYNEGKIEVEVVTDIQETSRIHPVKKEDGQQNNLNMGLVEQQIESYQQKIEQQQSLFTLIKQQSSNIMDNLKDHVSMKKQQFLNKIDFERKHIFAVEFQMNEQDGISSIHKIYYSKNFINIIGLDSKDNGLMESFMLKNGVIDLYEQLGLYEKKKENNGELFQQYLEPLTENQQKLKTLDNLSISVSINQKIINLSEEFLHMFADIGLQNISKEYFILYELDIPYDQIKQIENERKSIDKNGISSHFINNPIPNLLMTKYYSSSLFLPQSV